MIDDKGRVKGRISIIDIILVVALLVLSAGFAYRNLSPRLAPIVNPTDVFYVTITQTRLRHFVTDAIDVGDVVFRQHERNPIGRVTHIELRPAFDYMLKTDGTVVLAEMEDRHTIFITVEAMGSITERGFFINGNDHVAPGSHMALTSNRVFIPDGRIYSVEAQT